MAVSFDVNTGGELSFGSAVQAGRKAQQEKQLSAGEQFKNLLDGSKNLSTVSGTQSGGSGVKQQSTQGEYTVIEGKTSEIRKITVDLKNDERYEKALAALDREIESYRSDVSAVSSEVKEIAEKIVKGEMSMDDVPDDISTEELMKEIVAIMIEKRFDTDDEDEEKDEQLIDPAAAAANEQQINRLASDMMISELYDIIEKFDENEDKVDMLDGISEPVETDETLASVATAEDVQEGVFEQIIDNMTEGSEAAAEGTPVIQAKTEEPKADNTRNTVQQPETEAIPEAVQGAEQGGQSGGAQMSFGAETQKTGEALETLENETANDFDNVIESFTVKEARTTEEKPAEEAAATPVNARQSRVKNASEELEMLKSAKQGSKEESSVPAQTALDQPVVFTRADGSELRADPAAIVEQAQRLVERAIAQEASEQSEYSLVLNPEELGRITVKLIKAADGAISVTIAAENAQTQRILEQNGDIMQSNLRSGGVNLESWQTVNESQQETYAQDYSGSSKNPYFRRDEAQNGEDEGDERSFAEIIAAM